MIDEKTVKEYVADMIMYYESVHDSVPAQFEKYLRKAVEKGMELCKPNNEQLTKAKDIIRDLLSCLYSVEYDRISDLEQAEQFLKEVEE